jgi:AraC-like DNA-binding protein
MEGNSQAHTVLPVGRPFLLAERAVSDLLYLSWGRRTYGVSPVPVTAHAGWVYTFILSGSPLVVAGEGIVQRVGRWQMMVVGPNCPSGWNDERRKSCEQLTWVWRHPPKIPGVRAVETGFIRFELDENANARLQAMHEWCRKEMGDPDRFTHRALQSLHTMLDVELGRAVMPRTRASATRFGFARAWLDRHWREDKAVSQLAEYLQVSLSTLDRLFKREARMSAGQWIHRRKMQTAGDLIRDGRMTRKQIAYALGYAHPSDFSRAWSRWRSRNDVRHRRIERQRDRG